jgi:MFS family permease
MRAARLSPRSSLVVVLATMALVFAGSSVPTPLYPLYRQDLGFSRVTLSLIFAVYVVGTMAALFFAGRLSDQIGRRRTIFLAMGCVFASTLVFLFGATEVGLFVGRVLIGLAVGLGAGTCTAWVADLDTGGEARSATLAAAANMAGLGLGAVGAGMLARWAPEPLALSWVVYLDLAFALLALLWFVVDTVEEPVQRLREVSLRPRLGVPADRRDRFVPPATNAFCIFAMGGFYGALIPSVLAEALHRNNPALSGAVVAEFFLGGAVLMVVTQWLADRRAMLTGLVLIMPAGWLLVWATVAHSLPLLLIATAVGAAGQAVGFRGGLSVVNSLAPQENRAEVVSTYLLFCYLGLAVAPVGVAVLTTAWGLVPAESVFAGVLLALSAVGLAVELRRGASTDRDAADPQDVPDRRVQSVLVQRS